MAPVKNDVFARFLVQLLKSNETFNLNIRMAGGKPAGHMAVSPNNNSFVFVARNVPASFQSSHTGFLGRSGYRDRNTPYDSGGASMYVIVIIVIYGVTIVVMIAATMSDRNKSRSLDRQVANYVKNLNPINREARMFKADLMKQHLISASNSPQPTPTLARNQLLPFIAEMEGESFTTSATE